VNLRCHRQAFSISFLFFAASTAAAAAAVLLAADARAANELPPLRIDAKAWHVIARESGPVNYYSVVDDPTMPYVHAAYKPPYATTVLGFQLADADRSRAKRLRWTWRAVTLPAGGNECESGKGDSAAVVYVTWKRALRWYSLKYVWSSIGPKGKTCDSRRNPFVAQDTVILRSGGPVGTWMTEDIDLRAEFRNHFEGGDANADVPDLGGIGIMTDGDQTHSESAADYGPFSIVR
jgi:hypothetical protein